MAHKFLVRSISGDCLGHNIHFYSFFCQSFLCFFRSMVRSSILHEKGATTTQLSTMKYRQQPLVKNADVFFSIDISVTDHKRRTSSCPNGCWLQILQRKLVGWNPLDTDLIAVRKLQTWTHQRRQRYPKTPQACLSTLTHIAFCTQCWKGEEMASF